MKVWGFTIVKNAIKYDYPVIESVRSILPICDGVIILHGDSEDQTASLLSQLASPKVQVIDSVWKPELRTGGFVLAEETNKAFHLIPDDADWCFYIQADEVLHEEGIPAIKSALSEHLCHQEVKGLLLKYRHFYGSYDYIGMNSDWYKHEIRIIRKDHNIYSYKDAQGFRMNDNQKLPVREVDAYIHHYGWVKDPVTMQKKVRDFHKLWHDDKWILNKTGNREEFSFENIDVLEKYAGQHPRVMKDRIHHQNWNFEYKLNLNKYSLKDRAKNLVKNVLGKTPGEYRNYKLLK